MPVQPFLLFLDVSGGELLVIILVVFLVFGPQKMPEIARKIGKVMNDMKKASNDLTREFRQETSGIRKEIDAAHTGVKEEIDKVSREVNETRARINRGLSMDQPSAVEDASTEPLPQPEKPTDTELAG